MYIVNLYKFGRVTLRSFKNTEPVLVLDLRRLTIVTPHIFAESLLDNAPNHLVGYVIQKRIINFVHHF